MPVHEAGGPVFLTVDVAVVALAVVARAVGSLHAAAGPRPTGVVVAALHCSLAYAVWGV